MLPADGMKGCHKLQDHFDHVSFLADCDARKMPSQHVVTLHVSLQIVLPSERPRAGHTLEWAPCRVLAHVDGQVGLLPEGARADGALKRLLARVYTHVSHQMALPVQLAEADVTRIPLFWPARTLVLLQEHRAEIRAEANKAFVLRRQGQGIVVGCISRALNVLVTAGLNGIIQCIQSIFVGDDDHWALRRLCLGLHLLS